MFVHLRYALLLVCVIAVRLEAQTSRMYLPATEPDTKKLMADREEFVKEFYQPDAAAMAKIQKSMADVVPFQEKYAKDTALTLSRISLAMGIVSEPGTPESERDARMNKFALQATSIYTRAPLSLANVAKMAEAAITPDKVAAARAKMSGQLSTRLQGQPLDMAKLDSYFSAAPAPTARPVITRPVEQTPSLSDRQPAPTPPISYDMNQSTPTKNPAATPTPAAKPAKPTPAPQVQPPPPPAPPPPPPPKVVKIAPPKDTWTKDIDGAKKKYNYNPDQLKVVDIIVTSVMARADKPSTTKDVSGNLPIDVLYDELVQRLDSVATIEQKQKANPPAAKPAAAAPPVATPAATTQPAAGH